MHTQLITVCQLKGQSFLAEGMLGAFSLLGSLPTTVCSQPWFTYKTTLTDTALVQAKLLSLHYLHHHNIHELVRGQQNLQEKEEPCSKPLTKPKWVLEATGRKKDPGNQPGSGLQSQPVSPVLRVLKCQPVFFRQPKHTASG